MGTLPSGTVRIANIACGADHTLIILERAASPSDSSRMELWGCGNGSAGQLGPGMTSVTQVFHPLDLDLGGLGLEDYEPVLVDACWETSYAVLRHLGRDDVLLSMGADDFGDLGIGGARSREKQVHVVDLRKHLTQEHTPTGSWCLRVKSITTGIHHILVQLVTSDQDGTPVESFIGWGSSRHGQLGEWTYPTTGRPLAMLLSPQPITLQDQTPTTQISAGTQHTVSLHESGRVSALGSNRKGQIAGLADLTGVSAVGCTWHGTYSVIRHDEAWSIVSTGFHTRGQLGRRLPADTVSHPPGDVDFPFSHNTHELVKMACGSEHVLCLFRVTSDAGHPPRSEVWGWGWNEHGNLGLGTTDDQTLPIKLWPQEEADGHQPQAVDVWAGCGTSWIVLDS
ncbi:RCC1/BLIP-II [Trametopsis cervina]|nr:RCC1/BLIP-II [Trametopsis cervina]